MVRSGAAKWLKPLVPETPSTERVAATNKQFSMGKVAVNGSVCGLVQSRAGLGNTSRAPRGDHTNPKRKRGAGLPSLALWVSVPGVSPGIEPCRVCRGFCATLSRPCVTRFRPQLEIDKNFTPQTSQQLPRSQSGTRPAPYARCRSRPLFGPRGSASLPRRATFILRIPRILRRCDLRPISCAGCARPDGIGVLCQARPLCPPVKSRPGPESLAQGGRTDAGLRSADRVDIEARLVAPGHDLVTQNGASREHRAAIRRTRAEARQARPHGEGRIAGEVLARR